MDVCREWLSGLTLNQKYVGSTPIASTNYGHVTGTATDPTFNRVYASSNLAVSSNHLAPKGGSS